MAAGASGRKSRVTANRLRGFTPDFMSVDSLAFPFPKGVFKAAELLSNGRGTDAGCSGRPWNQGVRVSLRLYSTPWHFEGFTSDFPCPR